MPDCSSKSKKAHTIRVGASVVSQASKHHENAFRVCRELAGEDSNFYLSYKQLGDRIGIDSTQAGRILRQFIPLYLA
jgi:hypothetical protein